MNEKAWWIAVVLIVVFGVIGFIVPGLLIMNPTFFYYGGLIILAAVLLGVWVLTTRGSRSR